MSEGDQPTTQWSQEPAGSAQPSPGSSSAGKELEPTQRFDPLVVPQGRPGGPGGGPGGPGGPRPDERRKKTVPRGLFWTVLALFGVALVVIAGLVVLRPKPSSTAGAVATTTPSAAGSSPAASDSASESPAAGDSPSGGVATSPASSPSASSTATAAPATAGTNLFNLTPVQTTAVGSLVDGSEEIGTVTYPDSVRFTCESFSTRTNVVYDVAGSAFLNAVIGVPSDATNAAGNTMAITFFKDGSTQQLGKTISIALDQPAQVHLNLGGASQLEIACNATSTTTQQPVNMDIALGNAALAGS